MKPYAIALSGVGRRLRERDGGGNLPNVQYKPIFGIVTMNFSCTVDIV
jgi:hypothetical protein